MITRLVTFAMLLLLSACSITTPPTPPPVVCSEQHSWNDYHLAHDALSPVVVNESSYQPDTAAWNALGTPIQLRDAGEGFALHVVDGGDATSGWLGLASINVDADRHITRATVTMNKTILDNYPPVVAQHVLCQEIGHLLGLDHQVAVDSCMDDCAHHTSGQDWLACLSTHGGTTPNAHDAEQLNLIYEHAVEHPKPPPTTCVGAFRIVIDVFGSR